MIERHWTRANVDRIASAQQFRGVPLFCSSRYLGLEPLINNKSQFVWGPFLLFGVASPSFVTAVGTQLFIHEQAFSDLVCEKECRCSETFPACFYWLSVSSTLRNVKKAQINCQEVASAFERLLPKQYLVNLQKPNTCTIQRCSILILSTTGKVFFNAGHNLLPCHCQ
jgi:hypothetical protein